MYKFDFARDKAKRSFSNKLVFVNCRLDQFMFLFEVDNCLLEQIFLS